jgi:hypothetical protein
LTLGLRVGSALIGSVFVALTLETAVIFVGFNVSFVGSIVGAVVGSLEGRFVVGGNGCLVTTGFLLGDLFGKCVGAVVGRLDGFLDGCDMTFTGSGIIVMIGSCLRILCIIAAFLV